MMGCENFWESWEVELTYCSAFRFQINSIVCPVKELSRYSKHFLWYRDIVTNVVFSACTSVHVREGGSARERERDSDCKSDTFITLSAHLHV